MSTLTLLNLDVSVGARWRSQLDFDLIIRGFLHHNLSSYSCHSFIRADIEVGQVSVLVLVVALEVLEWALLVDLVLLVENRP